MISFTVAAGKLAYRLKNEGAKVRFCLPFLQCDKCLTQRERALENWYLCDF
jgi:hypothetical protein